MPTGDGICLALLKRDPYDLHIQLALSILHFLREHNKSTDDQQRQFQIRIGINSNTDNLVTDINGNRNVAGAGINAAQRVMDSADGNQILVSHAIHETLRHREKYMGAFRSYQAKTKHDEQVPVHQLIMQDAPGLNLDEPQAFIVQKRREPKLTEHVAYYLAHALANRHVLIKKKDKIYHDEAVIILLYFLAKDSVERLHATELDQTYPETYKAGSATFWEQYEYYSQLDRHLIWNFAHCVRFGSKESLIKYSNCFSNNRYGLSDFRAISEYGKRKLKEEWPRIWDEFALTDG